MQLREFLELLGKETGLAPGELEILAGFPPAPIAVPTSTDSTLSSLAILNGDTLLVRKRAEPAQAPDVSADAPAAAAGASNSPEVSHGECILLPRHITRIVPDSIVSISLLQMFAPC